MSQKTLTYIFYGLVLVGLADSMYLSITVLLGIAPTCGVLHGCETVAASSYSRLFGIPLAYLGVVYYTLGAILGGYITDAGAGSVKKGGLAYGALGALFSLWFVYIQAFIIGAFCIYCVASAVAAFGLLGVTYALYVSAKRVVIS